MNTPRWITIATSIFPLKNLYNYCYNISIYGYYLNIPNYFNSLNIVLLLFYFSFPLFIFFRSLSFYLLSRPTKTSYFCVKILFLGFKFLGF